MSVFMDLVCLTIFNKFGNAYISVPNLSQPWHHLLPFIILVFSVFIEFNLFTVYLIYRTVLCIELWFI